MTAAHSTVPRWPVEPPALDLTGWSYGVVSIGPRASHPATGWFDRLNRCGRRCWLAQAASAEAVLDDLGRRLAVERTGFRLLLAGPERDVLMMQAAARSAGLIDSEITVHVTGAERRRVYCVHCKHTTETAAAVEECTRCAGCGRELVVFAHLSRHTGSYLGFFAGAEELP